MKMFTYFTTLGQILFCNYLIILKTITDGIYGMLSNIDKKELLSSFITEKPNLLGGLDQKLDEILRLLKQNSPIN